MSVDNDILYIEGADGNFQWESDPDQIGCGGRGIRREVQLEYEAIFGKYIPKKTREVGIED